MSSLFRLSLCRLSFVCKVRAPYLGDWNFRQCFYAIWYFGHLMTSRLNFTEFVSGEPLRQVVKYQISRRVAEYSDFGPIERYISETV